MMKLVPLDTPARVTSSFPEVNGERRPQADGSFGEMLGKAIADVNQKQAAANQAIQDLATGRSHDIHGTMIAMEKSSISFQFMLQIRNKVLEAYQEVSRIQV